MAATGASSGLFAVMQSRLSRPPGAVATAAAMDASKTLHIHLEGWRKHKRLSQEKVANMLGTHKSTISRWETGERTIDLADLERLATVYQVDPIALLLAPGDVELARGLSEAKAILEAVPADAARTWLAMGRALVGVRRT